MRNIILILTLNIVFLSSMWNCNDKFNEMCKEYPLLLINLHKYNQGNNVFEKMIEPVNKMGEKLWALFEISLTDDFSKFLHSQESLNVDFIKKIINKEFLKRRDRVYSCFLDVSNNNNNSAQNNKNKLVYLFVSDINTVTIDVNPPHERVSLFRGVKGIKKVNVMCSNCPQKESNSAYVGDICELFRDCTNLEEVNLEKLNLNYLDVPGLFAGCGKLKDVKLQRTPFAKVHNRHHDSIGLMFARIFYDNIPENFIKVSCPDQFIKYSLEKIDKSFCIVGQNDHIYIKDIKDELKDSTCYRDFYIYLNEFSQSYMLKR